MKKTEAKLSLADVRVVYPKSIVKQIKAKYSFEFEFDGEKCRCWHDAQGRLAFTVPEDVGPELATLVDEIERLISDVDASTADVRKFLSKYMQMKVMIEGELQQIPRSKIRYQVTNLKPLDMGSLSVEKQCVFEALQEQAQKAHALAVAKGGKPEDEVTVALTMDMVKAKLEEKMRQKT
jgi:hypothetical protein